MKPAFERIDVPLGRSFRLLRWLESIANAEVVGLNGETHPVEGAALAWHLHPEFELMLVTRGTGTRLIGDHISSFNAPDLLLIGAGLPHDWHGLERSNGYAIQFCLDEAHPLHLLGETRELNALLDDAGCGIEFSGQTRRRVQKLLASMEQKGTVARFGLLMLILDSLLSAPDTERHTLSTKRMATNVRQVDTTGIQRAVAYVLDNYQQDLPLDALLRHAGMSKATFSRHFRRYTGKTFSRFLTEVRVDHAARLLIETDRTISEIAFEVGFNNLARFNYGFRLVHHCTPSEFRRNHATLS